MSTHQYTRLVRPSRGVHRFFTRNDRPSTVTFVADDSGSNPDNTDVGPIWFGPDADVEIKIDVHGVPMGYIMAETDYGRNRIMITAEDVAWLISESRVGDVLLSAAVATLGRSLVVIMEAAGEDE